MSVWAPRSWHAGLSSVFLVPTFDHYEKDKIVNRISRVVCYFHAHTPNHSCTWNKSVWKKLLFLYWTESIQWAQSITIHIVKQNMIHDTITEFHNVSSHPKCLSSKAPENIILRVCSFNAILLSVPLGLQRWIIHNVMFRTGYSFLLRSCRSDRPPSKYSLLRTTQCKIIISITGNSNQQSFKIQLQF